MPSNSHPISITVKGLDRLVLFEATVTITLGARSISDTTNKSGQVILNTAEINGEVNDTVTIVADKEGAGTLSTTLVLTSAPQDITMTLAPTSNLIYHDNGTNQHVLNFAMLTDYAGDKITPLNPLPVTNGDIDLARNPSHAWTIIRQDGQPDDETVTIAGVSYKRTFAYNVDNQMISRSAWVRQ